MTVDEDDGSVRPEDPLAEFAESLSAVRLEAGLSVRALSRLTRIPSGTLGGYFGGRHLPPANRPEVLDSILLACGVGADDLAWWRARLLDLHRGRRSAAVRRQPYRGLGGYGPDDGDLLFGRSALVDQLREQVESSAGEVVVVVGPSGTGKSSLLRAGLVPALTRDGGPGSWQVVTITPGDDPAGAVARAVDALADDQERPCLLVVDQFEELFTLTADEDERSSTVRRLVGWAQDPDARTDRVVVIGLRADHFGAAAAHPGLVSALRAHQVLVPPMDEDELRETIEGPADRVGLKLEWGLSEVVLADVRDTDMAHVLPHLAHTLEAMWDGSDRRQLRIRDYKAVGGVEGAVRRSAESAFTALPAEQQGVARSILLQLVTLSPGTAPSRRSRSRQDLISSHPAAPEVLDYLISHRLVTATQSEVSLSHETLIDAWPRLQLWLDEDGSDLLLRGILGRQEQVWRDRGRDDGLLLRGSLLEAVRSWRAEHRTQLTEAEAAYISASEDRATEQARERQRQHRRTRQLLVAAVALALVAVVAGAAAWRNGAVAATERDEARSRQVARVAGTLRESNVPLANQFALHAFQIAPTREARSALVDATAMPSLTRRVDAGGPLTASANAAGDLLAFGGNDGQVDLARLDGERLVETATLEFAADGTPVQSVAFDAAGDLLAVAGAGPAVQLLDTSAPARPAVVADLPVGRTVFDVAFSPDGRWLVAGADEDADGQGAVLLWERTGKEWLERSAYLDVEGSVRGVAVNGDGRVAAATTSGTAYLLTIVDEALELEVQARVGTEATRLFDVTLSPDGSRLATVGSDRTLRLYELGTPDPLASATELGGFGSWVNAVAFTPDSRSVVAGSSDSTIRVWELPEGGEPRLGAVLPVDAAVTSIDVVDDERMVFTTTHTSSYLWDRSTGTLPLHGDTIFVTRASADGSLTLTTPGTGDGTAYLWDTTEPRHPVLLGTMAAPEAMGVLDGSGAISRSGTTVVAGTSTGYVVSWDTSDPRSPRLLGGARIGESYIDYVDFFADDRMVVGTSNDGNLGTVALDTPDRPAESVPMPEAALSTAGGVGGLVATGGTGGDVLLWDGHDLAAGPVATIDVDLPVFALDLAADDAVLAVGGANNQVRLYDVSDPSAPGAPDSTLTGPAATVYSVQVSPDGQRLAAAALDGTVWVWRAAEDGFTPELVLQSPPAPLNAVGWIDDDHLVAGGAEGRAYLWLVDAQAAAGIVCGSTGSAATELEWETHLPGIDYDPPCDGPE